MPPECDRREAKPNSITFGQISSANFLGGFFPLNVRMFQFRDGFASSYRLAPCVAFLLGALLAMVSFYRSIRFWEGLVVAFDVPASRWFLRAFHQRAIR